MTNDYSPEVQKLFLELMLHKGELYSRIQNIYNPKNFHKSLQLPAEFIHEYAIQYSEMPTIEQVNATTNSDFKPIPSYTPAQEDWFFDEFESFTKKQEISRAIVEAADLLEKNEYDPVENIIKKAVQISLTKDLGISYFEDPKSRLHGIKENNGQMSTGWKGIDDKLYGGFNKGELNIFAGGSGSGKSLFMQNLALNWMEQGLSGIYLSLELSENLCAMRIDSMLTGNSTRKILSDIDNTHMALKMKAKKMGNLQIKYMPAQSTVNDIRAYIRELQIKDGMPIEFILVDYLDLVSPVSVKVNPSDVFTKDKYVSEELRNLAQELNILFVTASQLNRSAVEEVEFDHSMIAGGLSKINTADNVIGIFTSRAMRERGRYQVQFMKTRSSSGVGHKVDLEYDVESMRIYNAVESDSDDSETSLSPSSKLMDKIKSKSSVEVVDTESGEIVQSKVPKAEIQSGKLKAMLAGIKNS